MEKLKAFFKENIVPHLLPIAILFVIGSAYFYPALQGYSLKQGDVTNWIGAAHEIFNVQNTADDVPKWTSRMFSGMPSTQISATSEGNLLNYVRATFPLPRPLSMWMQYAFSFYFLTFVLSKNRWIGVLGAIAFSFSTYFIVIIEAGHITKAVAAGLMPLVIAGVVCIYQKKYWFGGALTAFAFGLQLSANHVQVTYYMGMLIVVIGLGYLWKAYKEKDFPGFVKSSVLAVATIVLGVLPNISNLVNTYEYGKYTTRGKTELTIGPDGNTNAGTKTSGLDRDYVVAWSYGLQESWSLLVPNAKGGASGSIIQAQEDFAKIKDPTFKQFVQQVYGGQLASFGRYINTYWGDQQFTSGPVYVGIVIVLLALLAMFFVEGVLKWVFFGGIIFSLTLSWGKNMMWLTDLFLDYAPGYNKFRAVTIIMIILELCFPALAILFIRQLITKPESILADKKKLLYVSGGLAGVLILFYAAPTALLDFTSKMEEGAFTALSAQQNPGVIQGFVDSLQEYRVGVFRKDVMRSILFLIAGFAGVYAFVQKKLKAEYMIGALCLIVLVDLFSVNKRYLNTEKVKGQYTQWEKAGNRLYPFTPSAADREIFNRELAANNLFSSPMLDGKVSLVSGAQDIENMVSEYVMKLKEDGVDVNQNVRDCERISFLTNQTNYRVFNLTVSPFNDASTSYFHKSIGGYHGAKLKRYQELIEFHLGGMNRDVLNMLNTKYFITQQGVQQNPEALGNAWFVSNINWVANADEEIMALKQGFNPAVNAVIDERYKPQVSDFQFDSLASIKQLSYHPERMTYESNASSDQFAVFSEIYYDLGWKAFVDGEEVPVSRVNYVLRGINIPAGKHTIEFKFELEKQGLLAGVAGTASIIIFLLVLAGLYFMNKDGENSVE